MLRCPKCDSEYVDYYNCYDMSIYGDFVIQHWSGSCTECKANLLWEEVYKFEKIQNIRIEKEKIF